MKNIFATKETRHRREMYFLHGKSRETIFPNYSEKMNTKAITKIDTKAERRESFYWRAEPDSNLLFTATATRMKIIYLPGLATCEFLSIFRWFELSNIIKGLPRALRTGIWPFSQLDPKHFSHYPSFHYYFSLQISFVSSLISPHRFELFTFFSFLIFWPSSRHRNW